MIVLQRLQDRGMLDGGATNNDQFYQLGPSTFQLTT
jgi:hypothetical protein